MDISEQCGHTLEEQIELFNGIKPLFANKPLLVILNKIDVIRPDELSEEKKELIKVFDQEGNILLDLHHVAVSCCITVHLLYHRLPRKPFISVSSSQYHYHHHHHKNHYLDDYDHDHHRPS